jgi:hypothetical protein
LSFIKNVILLKIYDSLLKKLLSVLTLSFFLSASLQGQDKCEPTFTLTPTTVTKSINWTQFPEFSLPFDICYGGPVFDDSEVYPLSRGFTHVSKPISGLPNSKRAYIYYGVAFTGQSQPWERLRSPWGNDEKLYQNKWEQDHLGFTNAGDANGNPVIDVDWFVYDVERQIKSNDSILLLRNLPSVPSEINALNDADFIRSYKKELQNLYYQPTKVFAERGLLANKVSSYADTPILNTFTDIQAHSWEEWGTNKALLNPNVYDFTNDKVGGNFYDVMNILMPSAYYYFDYPSPFAPEYLSYLLFQIEVNKAWSDKPVYPYVWLKYSANPALRNKFIRPWMAEATAIFPFFSGATGLWLWEDPTTLDLSVNYSAYEYFTKGLYRLSQFKDFFEGEYELVIETSAHELNRQRGAVWRGVVKGSDILVAAHNPFAKDENEETIVAVKYNNWSRLITLKGYEVSLCAYDMSVLNSEEELNDLSFVVFPNPANSQIRARFHSATPQAAVFTIFDSKGRKLKEQEVKAQSGKNDVLLYLPEVSEKVLFVRLKVGDKDGTIKILKR